MVRTLQLIGFSGHIVFEKGEARLAKEFEIIIIRLPKKEARASESISEN